MGHLMTPTKQQLQQDPYGACEAFLADPDTATEADRLFVKAARRVQAFAGEGSFRPDESIILSDVWDFFTDPEREAMQAANHPMWQALFQL